MNKVSVSILIATKDRFEDVKLCLHSVLNQTLLPSQIIIVDASDESGLNEICSNILNLNNIELTYLKSDIKSSSIQRNNGIDKNKCEYILIMDDDVILENNFISEAISSFTADNKKEIIAVSANITNTKKLSLASRLLRKIFLLQGDGKGEVKKSWANNNYNNLTTSAFVEWVSTCCTVFRAVAFENERFEYNFYGYSYMEDFDLSYRLNKKFKLFYNINAKCVHNHKHAQQSNEIRQVKQKMFMLHLTYLFKKNMPQRIDYVICHYWSFIGYIIRALLMERNKGYLFGTIEGIYLNVTGKNKLVKLLK